VESTDALTGSVNYEDGAPAGLTDFEDGEAIDEEEKPKFVRKTFTIGWKGKLIPISRILAGAEKAGLLTYLNRWFVKNAVISENKAIFGKLKSGYNDGTPKAVAGWGALKSSINKDLDPSCKLNGVIATNQSGFDCLDSEKFDDGRHVLQANPANPTEKLFQGLPVKVYPDAQLPNIDATHFPIFYGDTKAGCTFVEHQNLEFSVSEHYLFGKNQNCLRVVEGFDTMSTDTTAYIYGSLSATVKA
jgi:HK97 family phage major capsid protein